HPDPEPPRLLRQAALSAALRERAQALGFDRVAIGPAGPPAHGAEFERWLDRGYAGTMAYLGRGRAARLDPATLLPAARAVVAVALSYDGTEAAEGWAPLGPSARGRAYQ